MRKRKKRPFLGPLLLDWCDHCNVPIASGTHCGSCDSATRRVSIAPPGDVRPAFAGDLDRLITSITKQYGKQAAQGLIPSDKIVLLNAIPDLDCCEEVILDGQIIGLHRFRLEHLEWEFVPKLEGARRLAKVTQKKLVVIDDSAVDFIVSGANVLRPGIKDADSGIEPGDYVFVVNEQGLVVLTGLAAMTGDEMQTRERGVAVRKRYWGPPTEAKLLPRGQTWQQVLDANAPLLQRLEKKAITFVQGTVTEFSRPIAVAFSGGKDSLAVLLLVKKALPKQSFHVMFIDTGIEFPETIENVFAAVSTLGLKDRLIIKLVEKDQFFRVLDQFGLVARDFRVCCKTVKLGPIAQLIEEHFPKGCLSFIGQRRYESRRRANSGPIWENPWVPNQIGASPIQNWTALMVWLYLFQEKAPYNDLYKRGFERIGCMFCPASTMSEFDMIAACYPQEWERWYKVARSIAEREGLSEKWVKYGFWRWKKHPPKIVDLAKLLNVPLKAPSTEIPIDQLSYAISSPEKEPLSGSSIQGQFNQSIALDQAMAFLPVLGRIVHDLERDLIHIIIEEDDGLTCRLFGSGNFIISGPENSLKRTAEVVVKTILRGMLCTGCGSCQTLCSPNAIILKYGRSQVDATKCTRCRACIQGKCPTLYALHHHSSKE